MKLNDKQFLRVLRNEIDQALKPVGEKHRIVLACGKCTYSEGYATFRLEASEVKEDGTVVTRESEDFKRCCQLFALNEEDLGKTVVVSGNTYTIEGLNLNSNKFPILVKRSDGKRFKMPTEVIISKLGRTPA